MHLIDCIVSPPPPPHPHLGAMLVSWPSFVLLLTETGVRSLQFMETGGKRGREGGSQGRQGRLRGGDQNRQLNCRRRSRLSCRPQPSQEYPISIAPYFPPLPATRRLTGFVGLWSRDRRV